MQKVVAAMRDSFETKEFDIVQWILVKTNVTVGVTKRNLKVSEILNGLFVLGVWNLDLTQSCVPVTTIWN